MASLCTFSFIFTVVLSLSSLPTPTSSQGLSSGTILADCGPSLLPLTPCTPFVQGSAPSPPQQCCDNLVQLYDQQPHCLCLLLNGTALTLPMINTTLALHLPLLCHLHLNSSACPGLAIWKLMPPAPSSSLASPGRRVNSTVVASPVLPAAPRPGLVGFGLGHSGGAELKMEWNLAMVVVLSTAALIAAFTYNLIM